VIVEAEYARLLGYPAGKSLAGAVRDRADEAIAWYERHGNPRVYMRNGVVAITAGVEVEDEIGRRWRDQRVDEAYFLDRLATGVVEHLARSIGISPGPGGWDLERHPALIAELGTEAPVELLPSGMLKPVHSMLALVTGDSTTCVRCSFRCEFRRTA
jgi:hypothetical protein